MPVINFTIPVSIQSYLNCLDPYTADSLAGITQNERDELIIESNKKYSLNNDELILINENFIDNTNNDTFIVNNYHLSIFDLEKQILQVTVDINFKNQTSIHPDYHTYDYINILLPCFYNRSPYPENHYTYNRYNYFYYTENYRIVKCLDDPKFI